jgi:hypothetical protein
VVPNTRAAADHAHGAIARDQVELLEARIDGRAHGAFGLALRRRAG